VPARVKYVGLHEAAAWRGRGVHVACPLRSWMHPLRSRIDPLRSRASAQVAFLSGLP
jgi:hypothetical protein